MVESIARQEEFVDSFEDMTLLFADIVGFSDYCHKAEDPRDVVVMLSKIFSRFDHVCKANKVYKVHTIGDCYVLMGYSGRVDRAKRGLLEAVNESHQVIQTALEMVKAINEMKEEDKEIKDF